MPRRDAAIGAALVAAAFVLYAATLLPGVGYGDTAELQRVGPTLGLAHITGYPLYTLLGWGWSHLPLGGTPAWRMNLFSAAAASMSTGVIYVAGREMRQSPLVAAAGAATLATSATFWSQATQAEVYAFAALLEALLILATLRWRAGRASFALVGLVFGLGMVHHRTTILLVPGLLLFVVLERLPRLREWLSAMAAALAASLLYLYVPLRAAPWQDRWQLLLAYLTASSGRQWFHPRRLLEDGIARPFGLFHDLVWPQMLPIGLGLAVLGAVAVMRRDRPLAALLAGSYLLVFAFCSAYYAVDVAVFLIPAHVVAALLLGEGAMVVLKLLPCRWRSLAGVTLFALPYLLVTRNIVPIHAENTDEPERAARAVLARPLQPHAIIAGDGFYVEGLRYLQVVEGLRPDLELDLNVDHRYLRDALARGRPVYLLEPDPQLGLAQWPEAGLWRIGAQAAGPATPADLRWEEGITLAGYMLPVGPYRPGDVVPITLKWVTRAAPRQGYTMFVHLIGPDGVLHGQQDRPPAGTPTERWRAGDTFVEILGPTLAPSAPPGRYRVLVGWYEFPSLRRLPRASEQAAADARDVAVLGEIDVRP